MQFNRNEQSNICKETPYILDAHMLCQSGTTESIRCRVLLDTGASGSSNIISPEIYEQLRYPLHDTKNIIQHFKVKTAPLGEVRDVGFSFDRTGKMYTESFHVCPNAPADVLLCRKWVDDHDEVISPKRKTIKRGIKAG